MGVSVQVFLPVGNKRKTLLPEQFSPCTFISPPHRLIGVILG